MDGGTHSYERRYAFLRPEESVPMDEGMHR